MYTVRSAYRLLVERNDELLGWRVDGNWRKLWQVEVPPKIKHHIWRLARGVLPTQVAIRSRGMEVAELCGCCGQEEETCEHLFFRCVVAERYWEEVGVGSLLHSAQQVAGGAANWLFHIFNTASQEQIQRVFLLLWAIWKERSERV
ncbi:hypothetical protein LINPERPRIM_LOCUS26598 [Linum perenne]